MRAVEDLLARAVERLRPRVSDGGALSAEKLEREQHAAHGLAWLATYVEAIREMAGYASRMQAEGRFGETEALLTQIGLGEYLAQIFGGVAMNQGEIVRLADFGLSGAEIAAARTRSGRDADRRGNRAPKRGRGWRR